MKTIYLSALQLIALFTNAVPIIIAIIYYAQGGEDWGGKIPLFVEMTLIFMMVSGLIGLGTLGRVFYQLNMNKNYDGSQGSIRAILFVGLLYLVVIVMGGISISQYSSNNTTCSLQKIYSLWDQEVYEEGQQAYSNFCHQCKCKINENDLKYYSLSQLESINYSIAEGAENISKCKPEEGQLQTNTFDRLKKMEQTFSCAGFCSQNLAFTFQGVKIDIYILFSQKDFLFIH